MATAKVFTSDELVSAVRDALTLPNTASTGTDTPRILQHLNIALQSQLLPELFKVREEYGIRETRTALVSGTSRYRIPHRAFMLKLRNLYWAQGSGQVTRLDPKEQEDFGTQSGDPAGYYLEGTDVVLLPTLGSSDGSIQFKFYFRPGDLVLTTDARQVTSVNLTARTLVIDSARPSTWATVSTLDIHSPLSGGEVKVWDYPGTFSGTTITFAAAYPIDGSRYGTKPVEVGDWVCLAGEAVVPGIPKEMHGLLIDAAALRCVKGQGDQQNIQSQTKLLRDDLGGMVEQIESRNEGSPLRIKGRRGILRAGRWRW